MEETSITSEMVNNGIKICSANCNNKLNIDS